MVTGLLGISMWFGALFIKDRENKLEFLMREQIAASKELQGIQMKLSLLEQTASQLSLAQKQAMENQALNIRNLDRLTVIIDEMRKLKP